MKRDLDLAAEEVVLAGRSVTLLRPRSVDDLLERGVGDGRQQALYWADAWPSGRALAALVGERDLAGRRVLELACGLGLPSLAAALRGADVLASDVAPEALTLLRRNARRVLGRRLATVRVDLREPAPAALLERAPFDLVLVGDALYDEALTEGLARLLPALVAPSGEALVASPWAGQGERLVGFLPPALACEPGELAVPRGAHRSVRLLRVRPRP